MQDADASEPTAERRAYPGYIRSLLSYVGWSYVGCLLPSLQFPLVLLYGPLLATRGVARLIWPAEPSLVFLPLLAFPVFLTEIRRYKPQLHWLLAATAVAIGLVGSAVEIPIILEELFISPEE